VFSGKWERIKRRGNLKSKQPEVKLNLTPQDEEHLYTDGKDYYRLIKAETEPMVTIQRIGDVELTITKPMSEWAHLVRLLPETPIPAEKKPRRTRKDKGTHKGKPAEELANV